MKIVLDSLIHNPHAGEILKSEFLDELSMSQNALARAINVPPNRIHAIIKGDPEGICCAARTITADTDLRLCRYFGLSEGYFLRLQNSYQLMEAKRKLGEKLNVITPLVLS